jgi:ferric-dicitrate binding protein FerR (iron transport regulator)
MENRIRDLITNPEFRKFILNPSQGDGDYWEGWANEHPENFQAFEEAKSIIKDFYEPLSPEEFQIEAMEFQRRIGITQSEKNDIISLYETRRPKRNPWPFRVAASLTFLLALSLTISWIVSEQNLAAVEVADGQILKEAQRGQKLTITLPDGSTAKLNSESSIEYPSVFDKEVRKVTIIGEVFFDITTNEDWPFIVSSKDVLTKVLGTSFNVSSYSDEEYIKVALVEGTVEVSAKDKAAVSLSPSEMAVIHEDEKEIIIKDFDIRKETAWKDNIIYFDGVTFDEMQRRLERWYNVEFVYDVKPVFEEFEGDFTNETLEVVLKGMSANKFEYKLDGNKVFIN